MLASMQVLLTTCRDHAARLWLESGTSGVFSTFSISKGGPDHAYSWLTYHTFLCSGNAQQSAIEDEQEVSAAKLANSDNSSSTDNIADSGELYSSCRSVGGGACAHQGLQRFSSTPIDSTMSDEWIVEVKSDRIVAFWRLSKLVDTSSPSLPDSTLWLQTKVPGHHAFETPSTLIAVCREIAEDSDDSPRKVCNTNDRMQTLYQH
jgi:hypothetical protein